MNKFKVGDWVRRKPEFRHLYPGGDAQQVVEVYPTYVRVHDTRSVTQAEARMSLTIERADPPVASEVDANSVRENINQRVAQLPEAAAEREQYPMADGLLDYFPNALAYVSKVSHDGNQQHNPGEPMHWARDKSTDHRNKIMRHLIDFDLKDERGIYHAGRAAWRALALLQVLLEEKEGAPLPRNVFKDNA